MIISRTPFRISFFGGGTDYPVWYRENGGAVLGTSIDKYCYLSCRVLPPFFEHKHRIVYSRIENTTGLDDIEHPAVRAVLQYLDVKDGLEIHHDGDLPARSGLGSSSSFTVGMIHSIYALQGIMSSKLELASTAIHIEQNVIKENVGSQDQILAAFGGFNRVDFNYDDDFKVSPIILNRGRLQELQDHLILYFTGFSRFASDIAAQQIKNTPNKARELTIMRQMVDEAVSILNSNCDISEFGRLLNDSWKLKKSLSNKISNSSIDEIYQIAKDAGAIGGKLLGAGGGGFMLLFARPEAQEEIKERLNGLLQVPFNFENHGTQIVVYQPDITSHPQEIRRMPTIPVVHREAPIIFPDASTRQPEVVNV